MINKISNKVTINQTSNKTIIYIRIRNKAIIISKNNNKNNKITIKSFKKQQNYKIMAFYELD